MAANNSSNSQEDISNFISTEKFNESFPDEFPGITRFASAEATSNLKFDSADIALVNSLSNLSPSAMVDEIRTMHSIACRLEAEENQEKVRGKILRVLLD